MVLADLVEMPQGLMICKNTEQNRQKIHPERFYHPNDRSSHNIEDYSLALVWQSDPAEKQRNETNCATLLLPFEGVTKRFSASVTEELEQEQQGSGAL